MVEYVGTSVRRYVGTSVRRVCSHVPTFSRTELPRDSATPRPMVPLVP